jgi:hypothetical protein
MGYGPCDENRLGFCWRNEHGSGTRLTPYFLTEKDCEEFHKYMAEIWLKSNQIELSPQIQQMQQIISVGWFGGRGRDMMMADLRVWKIKDAVRCAKDFERHVGRNVIASCKGETMLEFYGLDLDESHDDKYRQEEEDEDEVEETEEDEVGAAGSKRSLESTNEELPLKKVN